MPHLMPKNVLTLTLREILMPNYNNLKLFFFSILFQRAVMMCLHSSRNRTHELSHTRCNMLKMLMVCVLSMGEEKKGKERISKEKRSDEKKRKEKKSQERMEENKEV